MNQTLRRLTAAQASHPPPAGPGPMPPRRARPRRPPRSRPARGAARTGRSGRWSRCSRPGRTRGGRPGLEPPREAGAGPGCARRRREGPGRRGPRERPHDRWARPGRAPGRLDRSIARSAPRRSAHAQQGYRLPSALAGRREALPPLEAARLDHVPAARGRHPDPEPVGLAAVRLLGLKGSLYRSSPAVRSSQIAPGDATERRARTAWSRQYIRSTRPSRSDHPGRQRAGGGSGSPPAASPTPCGPAARATEPASEPAPPPVVDRPRHC